MASCGDTDGCIYRAFVVPVNGWQASIRIFFNTSFFMLQSEIGLPDFLRFRYLEVCKLHGARFPAFVIISLSATSFLAGLVYFCGGVFGLEAYAGKK